MKLKERKIEIIDETLIELWKNYKNVIKNSLQETNELISLIYFVGCDYIEITEDLCEMLFPLPEYIEFRLNYSKVIGIKSTGMLDEIIRENSVKMNTKKIRMMGLDDLIFYDYEKELRKIIDAFGIEIEMCIGNDYGCSTAMAMEWIKLGGKCIITSFAGIGGNTSLEELLGSLRFIEKINIRGNHVLLPELSQKFEKITGKTISYTKPIIGKDIFNVESGIHVDGIEKKPQTFEPYDPIEIGRKRNIIIGKHSGIKSIKIKLDELKIPYKIKNLSSVLEEVRKESSKQGRGLNNEEIIEICKKVGAIYE